ncbi:heparinase II/III family protein [Treponema sp. OttesenSCG-928-L16]|nr:heparinase II/III family protein [Treponema sp. OttesenSCG-928-L16]
MDALDTLLAKINFDYPGLASARKAFEQNDKEACLGELIAYYKARESPVYLFPRDEIHQCAGGSSIREADDVLDHRIYGEKLPEEIDWMFNPTAETSRDNEWSWSLYRNIYWQPLARAYTITGDEKYAREFVKQLKSFSAAWPAAPFMTDTSFETKFKFPGHAWRTIETGIRIYTTWLPCFTAFRSSPSWDREGWIVFLNMIWDHAEFLTTHYSNHDRSSNWLTMEASALLQLGIFFPEMVKASDWKLLGFRRVMHEIKYSFDNDGIHMERTPIYHLVSAIAFFQAVRLCKLNGIAMPDYAMPTLIKAAEFIMYLVKPDFSTPMIGDADRNDLLAERSDTSVYEGMNLTFDPRDLNEIRAFFRVLAELSGREDFRWFASGRGAGHAPRQRNMAWKDAGIYVMRTGWSPGDSYMLMHGVQLERGERSTHSHNDAGHLELMLSGEDVLIDSGRYIYNSSCWKDWRHYFLSAKAHNTLYVDDHEMGTVPNVSRVRGVRTFCHDFRETEFYQIIDLSHNGYVFMDDPVFHRRRAIRLAGDICIIDDMINGLGLSKHDFRLYFNFAPGDLSDEGNYSWLYTSAAGNKYSCKSIINRRLTSSILKGSEDPKGGWVSYGYPVREPIPQLCLSAEGPAPLRFITVLAPQSVIVDGEGTPERASIYAGGSAADFAVRIDGENITISKDGKVL